MVLVAIDVDSTLHDYWSQLSEAAMRRFGIELPYEDQQGWEIDALTGPQLTQIIDDTQGRTLVAASTMEKPVRTELPTGRGNKKAAALVGAALAARAIEKGIKKVVFDRNGYPFHGRIKDLAEAARKAGLQF